MSTIIHIGYHRTGTSFLQKSIFPQCQKHAFHGHPEMLEHGLIDVAWRADRSIDYNKLIETYRGQTSLISFESFVGPIREGSTLIDVIPFRFKRIWKDDPVKILITIRKQDEFLKSYYAQWVASGGTTKIANFLRNDLDRSRFDLNTLNYWTTYSNYAEIFGAENVLVLPQELMKKDLPQFLSILNAFTGEEFQTVEKQATALNRSLSGYQLKWMRFINRIFETQMSIDYLIPKRYFNTMKYRIKLQHSNFLRFGKSFSQAEEAQLKEIMESYFDSNKQLQAVFKDYPLKEYGYYQ